MHRKIGKARKYMTDALRKPEPPSVSFSCRDLRFFFRFVKPVWKPGATGLLLTLIATALGSILPLGSKVLIDFVIMGRRSPGLQNFLVSAGLQSYYETAARLLQSINFLVLAMLVIGLLIGLIDVLRRYLTFRFQQELTFNLQTGLFDHLLRFPMSFFKKGQTGYLMARVSDDVNALRYLFSQSVTQLITNIFHLFFGIAILFALSFKLTMISLVLLPLYLAINFFFAGRQRSVSRDEREKSAQVTREMQEVLSGVEVIKSHVTEAREVDKVSGKLRSVINTRIKALVLSMISNHAVRSAQFLSTLLIMWFGALEIKRGAMTIGDYVAFTTYVVYLSSSVRNLSLFHIMLQPLFASLDRLMELFRMVPELPGEGEAEGIRLHKVKGEIKFERVSFAYEEGPPVLREIDLTVKPGEVIALVGPSGVGKTTLVNLLLKFYLPKSGAIYLDGHDYAGIDTRWLRERIGVVSQDIFLFNDTVEKNIRYGRPSAGMDEVMDVARKAHIHNEIAGFPDGYKTVIGERGVKLSAGQRQRISIARAFLREPPVIVLDEPTSALDAGTEKLIKDSLKELLIGRTTFIITHRGSIANVAQRVLALEDGRLVERSPLY